MFLEKLRSLLDSLIVVLRSLRNKKGITTLILFASSTIFFQFARMLIEVVFMQRTTPTTFGYWKLWQLLFIYTPILHLGIPNGANRNIPFFKGAKNEERVINTSNTSFSFALFASIIAGIISYLVAHISMAKISLNIPWVAIFPLSLGLAVSSWLLLVASLNFLKSFQKFKLLSKIQIIFAIILLTGTIVVYHLKLVGFLLILSIACIVGIIQSLLPLGHYIKIKFVWDEVKELIPLGFPILLVGFMYSLLTTVDRLLITFMKGAAFVGDYSLAILLFGALSLVPLTLAQFYYPKISHLFGTTNSVKHVFRLSMKQNILAVSSTVLVSSITLSILPLVVTTFLPAYASGLSIAYALSPGLLGLSFMSGSANFLHVIKQQKLYLMIQGLAIILNIIFSTLLFARFNIMGIALGTSLTYLIYGAMMLWAAFHMSDKLTTNTSNP